MSGSIPSTSSATSEICPSVPPQLEMKAQPRKRQYVQYYPNMEAALTAVNDGLSTRMAAEKYDVSQRTLYNTAKRRHPKKAGRPNTFSLEEETEICEILIRCSKIGVPLGKRTLIKIVKAVALVKGKPDFVDFRSYER
ncbi:hypothetical protein RvY_02363-2 [Ramazzottius varieornatus]|uniref:HTH psq-type domain-containing protein n=1 Tax=Ramazzottius varieornatus TaxID=947166 RepID=A0A1D1UU07_RAMVA|nr:hypothetical protein RvY_02363-2 [Ramazzottius varieornatus]